MKIDILIPNYNGAHLFEKNLKKVIASHKLYIGKIIIVDDGSEQVDLDRLEKIVQNAGGSVNLIKHKNNQGFSSAINTAASHSSADFIVLLNSDVVPRENCRRGDTG